jgi:hypothetical protein
MRPMFYDSVITFFFRLARRPSWYDEYGKGSGSRLPMQSQASRLPDARSAFVNP